MIDFLPQMSKICTVKIQQFTIFKKATSLIGWLAPIPQFLHVFKTKDTKQLPNLTFHFISLNQIAWLAYAEKSQMDQLYLASIIGFLFYFTYAMLTNISRKQTSTILIFIICIILEFIILKVSTLEIAGFSAASIQFIGSFMNAELLLKGWKEQNGSIFNLTSISLTLTNNMAWVTLAFLKMDIFMIIPNCAEAFINFLQLSFSLILPKKESKTIKKD